MRTPEQVRDLVGFYIRKFNARDFDAMMDIYAEDATLEDPVGTGLNSGKRAIRAFYDQYLDQPSFLQLTGDFRYAADAVAFSFFCYLGDPAEPTVVQITDTFRFDEEGLVREMRAFWGEGNVHGVGNRPSVDGGQLPLGGMVGLVVGNGDAAAACALEVAAKGAIAVIADEAGAAAATVASVLEIGGRALALPVQLLAEHELERLPEIARDQAKRLDFCVNVLSGEEAARRTALSAGEQLRSFHSLLARGAIVNVVRPDWSAAMPEAIRLGASRAARINCIVPGVGTSPESVANTVSWIVSAHLDDQVISLGDA